LFSSLFASPSSLRLYQMLKEHPWRGCYLLRELLPWNVATRCKELPKDDGDVKWPRHVLPHVGGLAIIVDVCQQPTPMTLQHITCGTKFVRLWRTPRLNQKRTSVAMFVLTHIYVWVNCNKWVYMRLYS
jgi:hypothetical protein